MSERRPLIATYIEASRPFGVIYTGVTSNLYRRSHEHRTGAGGRFTQRYGCHQLVWYQPFERIVTAIRREKAIKHWKRSWKMQLIEQRNPDWLDLYPWLHGEGEDPRLPVDDEAGVKAFLKRLEAGEWEGD